MKAALTTVSWRCAICGTEFPSLWNPMGLPIPLGRIRVCRQCRRVVCPRDSTKAGAEEYECVECQREGTID